MTGDLRPTTEQRRFGLWCPIYTAGHIWRDWTGRDTDLKAFANKGLIISQNETLTFLKMFVFLYAI